MVILIKSDYRDSCGDVHPAMVVSSGSSKARAAFDGRFGEYIDVYKPRLLEEMNDVADWVNNCLGEECLFEVEG